MVEHVMQFGDGGADWCINCGTFSIYCDDEDCNAEPTARFDTVNNADNYVRIFHALFGEEVANV